jgi:hypothetical protein
MCQEFVTGTAVEKILILSLQLTLVLLAKVV